MLSKIKQCKGKGGRSRFFRWCCCCCCRQHLQSIIVDNFSVSSRICATTSSSSQSIWFSSQSTALCLSAKSSFTAIGELCGILCVFPVPRLLPDPYPPSFNFSSVAGVVDSVSMLWDLRHLRLPHQPTALSLPLPDMIIVISLVVGWMPAAVWSSSVKRRLLNALQDLEAMLFALSSRVCVGRRCFLKFPI